MSRFSAYLGSGVLVQTVSVQEKYNKSTTLVRVLSHQFTRERFRCRIIKGVTFIDKTEINRAEVRVQTLGKGSLLENRRMVKVRPGQSLAGEQRR